MKQFSPRVSLGMPVRNGEKYIAEAIDSILAQTFGDYELIISDNASDDGTEAICTMYAAKDRRIRYHRNAQNIGGAGNFNRVFELASAEYFRWAAHDDVMRPEYLRRCIERLDANPDAVLCQTRVCQLNERGERVSDFPSEAPLASPSAKERFRFLLWCTNITTIFGVMRSDAMRRTRMFRKFAGGDRSFLAEMLLLGRASYIDECLCAVRVHAQSYSGSLRSNRLRRQWYDPLSRTPVFMQGAVKFPDYAATVLRSPIPAAERAACLAALCGWTAGRAAQETGRRARRLMHAVHRTETTPVAIHAANGGRV